MESLVKGLTIGPKHTCWQGQFGKMGLLKCQTFQGVKPYEGWRSKRHDQALVQGDLVADLGVDTFEQLDGLDLIIDMPEDPVRPVTDRVHG